MATYRPDPASEWLAAVRGNLVLVVPSSSAPTLAELWPRLAEPDPTALVLDRLAENGLASTPSFALVVRDDEGGARAVVRGPLGVRAGGTTVSGIGVSTWAERMLDPGDVGHGEMLIGPVAELGADGGDASLPVLEAVVPARCVRSSAHEPVAQGETRSSASAAVLLPAAPPTPAPSPPAFHVSVPPVRPAPPPATAPAPATVAAEQTMVPVEDTIAVPVPLPGRVTPAATGSDPVGVVPIGGSLDGDHDGLTVASVDLRRLRAERAERAERDSEAASAPDQERTRPGAVPNLRMPDGALEAIGHEVVLGRAPSVSQVSGVRLPRLVTIGAGDPDISRNHLRVTLEGGTVVVTDLQSRNGTHAVAPGKPPIKLRAGEPTPVLVGTVLDLGGGWTIQVVGD